MSLTCKSTAQDRGCGPSRRLLRHDRLLWKSVKQVCRPEEAPETPVVGLRLLVDAVLFLGP